MGERRHTEELRFSPLGEGPRRATSGDGLALVNRFRNGGADRCAALPARSLPMDRDQRDLRPDARLGAPDRRAASARRVPPTGGRARSGGSAASLHRTRAASALSGLYARFEPDHALGTGADPTRAPSAPRRDRLHPSLSWSPQRLLALLQPWRDRGRGHSHHPAWTASCRLVGNPHNAGRGSPVRPLVRGRGLGDEAPFLPEHFLHLDVLFCMAAPQLAVACVQVLGDDFADWLKTRGIRVIDATYREVMAMACNLLALGGDRSSRRATAPESTRRGAPRGSRSWIRSSISAPRGAAASIA